MVEHQGSEIDHGHYVAFVKRGSQWYRVDDSEVSLISDEAVLKRQPYIFFYYRDQSFNPSDKRCLEDMYWAEESHDNLVDPDDCLVFTRAKAGQVVSSLKRCDAPVGESTFNADDEVMLMCVKEHVYPTPELSQQEERHGEKRGESDLMNGQLAYTPAGLPTTSWQTDEAQFVSRSYSSSNSLDASCHSDNTKQIKSTAKSYWLRIAKESQLPMSSMQLPEAKISQGPQSGPGVAENSYQPNALQRSEGKYPRHLNIDRQEATHFILILTALKATKPRTSLKFYVVMTTKHSLNHVGLRTLSYHRSMATK